MTPRTNRTRRSLGRGVAPRSRGTRLKARPRTRTFERLEPRELLATDLPNIIVINTDDQRWDTMEYMPTLAAELLPNATVFENSFVPTAVCAPSRASLFTGQYAFNHGVLHVEEPLGGFENFDNTATLATWLDEVGYNTAMIGKYMNGYDQGAFVNLDTGGADNSYVAPGWDVWRAMLGATFANPTMSIDGVNQFYPQTYTTDLLTDFAEEFILDNSPTDDEPFFLYYAPHNPHSPSTVAPRHVGVYDDLEPYRPPSFNEADVSDKPAWVQNNVPLLDQAGVDAVDQFRQDQLESMLSVDEGIDRMLDALESTGELDNTVIIYTSDNGQNWGEHRFTLKGPAWEESIRVPLVIYDGRDATPQSIDEMALNIDLAPTIMDYVLEFAPPPSQTLPMDGASLLPLIDGETVAWRDEFLLESYSGGGGPFFGVRTEDFTYTEYQFTVGTELYDLQNDPYQLESKHDDPAYAATLADMQSRLAALLPSDDVGPVVTAIDVVDNNGVKTLEVTISDAATGGSEVRNAEYFLGAPGDPADGTPLIASDGVYDSHTEQQFVELPPMGGDPFTVYVHGRDVSGAWGEFVSIQVDGDPPVDGGEVVYRVNAGGVGLAGTPAWSTDTDASPSPYSNYDPLVSTSGVFTTAATIDLTDPSIPAGTPMELFQSARFDKTNQPNLEWDFPVTPGEYEVRLYFAEIFSGGFSEGYRVFDVEIEGVEVLSDYDVFADVGAETGVVKSFTVTSDGELDIDLLRLVGLNDPAIMAIEIVTVGDDASLAGDFNGDGAVNNADYTVWRETFNSTVDLRADGNGNGVIDVGDYTIWRDNFGQTASASSASSAVAETTGEETGTASGAGGAPSARLGVTPGGSINGSSTFKSGSFVLQNTSTDGDRIASVRIDLSTAFLPDMVFDPNGGAGDTVGKPFTIDSGASATGQNGFSYQSPHDDGFDVLEVTFDDFAPGEEFTWSIDIDPTTTRGVSAPGPGESASVSGFEIAGATVTVIYESGVTQSGRLFGIEGSSVDSEALLASSPPAAPTIELLGVSTSPSIVTGAAQTLRIHGPVGASVRVSQTETALFLPASPFDVDPFETNKVVDSDDGVVTIGASGFVDVPVTLLSTITQGGVNLFAAVIESGGLVSEPSNLIVAALDDLPPGSVVPGDYDGDADADQQDYDLWAATLGSTSDLRADGNDDAVVDVLDYLVWRENESQFAVAESYLALEGGDSLSVLTLAAVSPNPISEERDAAFIDFQPTDADNRLEQLLLHEVRRSRRPLSSAAEGPSPDGDEEAEVKPPRRGLPRVRDVRS